MDARMTRALPVLLTLGCVWGGSFLFIEKIIEDTGTLEVVLGRLFFGVAALAAYVLFTRQRVTVSPLLILQTAILGLLANVIPFALITAGQEHISSGNASILNATVPIFTALIAAGVLSDEYLTTRRVTGLLLGVLGVGALTGEGVLDITSGHVLGQFAVIGAAACYGAGGVYARNLMRGRPPITIALLQLSLGTVMVTPLLFAVEGGSPDLTLGAEAWASLIALGLLGTGFGTIAWLWLINNVGSVKASVVTYIVPVIAVFLGWLLLDEGIGVNTVAGGVLILAGVASVIRAPAPVRAFPSAQQAPAIAAGK